MNVYVHMQSWWNLSCVITVVWTLTAIICEQVC